MTDKEFLQWIHGRLVDVHGENPNMDYMHRLQSIIETTPVKPLAVLRTFKVLARHHHTNKQANKRNYTSKVKFDLHSPEVMQRYSKCYGIAEAYELIGDKWILLRRITSEKPYIR